MFAVRGHRCHQGRHAGRPQSRIAGFRGRSHRRPGDRVRWRVQPGRPARHCDPHRPRGRGRHRRQSPLRRAIHLAAGAGRGAGVAAMDLDALVTEASAILDAAVPRFLDGHRADSAVPKKGDDFATEVDLAIERQVVAALEEATGIGVHGEEFGGTAVDSPWVWVLDPVDGTFNYAAGSPMAAILLGLLHDGDPVAGLTWLPFTDERYTAVAGRPLMKDGAPRPVPGAVSAGGAGKSQPGVFAVAHARVHRD